MTKKFKRISINQPSYMPWCGFFDFIYKSDTFVVLDDVQFSTSGWVHRNRIKVHDGKTIWLTVPIKREDKFKNITDIRINYSNDWIKKHINSIKTYYSNANRYNIYIDEFYEILRSNHSLIVDLNWELLGYYCKCLGIQREIIKSSDLKVKGKGVDKVINICKSLEATHYYASGVTSRHLYDRERFESEGVVLEYQEYKHPVYAQLWGEFIPYMCILDFLFNAGSDKACEFLFQ